MNQYTPELGRFYGDSNPNVWVFQAERYFKFYGFSKDSWLSMPYVYFKGEARAWFDWLYRNDQFYNWDHFTKKLAMHYHNWTFADPVGHGFSHSHVVSTCPTYSSQRTGSISASATHMEVEDTTKNHSMKIEALVFDKMSHIFSVAQCDFEEANNGAKVADMPHSCCSKELGAYQSVMDQVLDKSPERDIYTEPSHIVTADSSIVGIEKNLEGTDDSEAPAIAIADRVPEVDGIKALSVVSILTAIESDVKLDYAVLDAISSKESFVISLGLSRIILLLQQAIGFHNCHWVDTGQDLNQEWLTVGYGTMNHSIEDTENVANNAAKMVDRGVEKFVHQECSVESNVQDLASWLYLLEVYFRNGEVLHQLCSGIFCDLSSNTFLLQPAIGFHNSHWADILEEQNVPGFLLSLCDKLASAENLVNSLPTENPVLDMPVRYVTANSIYHYSTSWKTALVETFEGRYLVEISIEPDSVDTMVIAQCALNHFSFDSRASMFFVTPGGSTLTCYVWDPGIRLRGITDPWCPMPTYSVLAGNKCLLFSIVLTSCIKHVMTLPLLGSIAMFYFIKFSSSMTKVWDPGRQGCVNFYLLRIGCVKFDIILIVVALEIASSLSFTYVPNGGSDNSSHWTTFGTVEIVLLGSLICTYPFPMLVHFLYLKGLLDYFIFLKDDISSHLVDAIFLLIRLSGDLHEYTILETLQVVNYEVYKSRFLLLIEVPPHLWKFWIAWWGLKKLHDYTGQHTLCALQAGYLMDVIKIGCKLKDTIGCIFFTDGDGVLILFQARETKDLFKDTCGHLLFIGKGYFAYDFHHVQISTRKAIQYFLQDVVAILLHHFSSATRSIYAAKMTLHNMCSKVPLVTLLAPFRLNYMVTDMLDKVPLVTLLAFYRLSQMLKYMLNISVIRPSVNILPSLILIYSNLEDKVLYSGGSIVMNKDSWDMDNGPVIRIETSRVVGPRAKTQSGQMTTQPNKRLMWDPG